jgi:uncharacterized protein YdhG (YjbR/CyaY superfamily)
MSEKNSSAVVRDSGDDGSTLIDAYIAGFSGIVRERLEAMRRIIREEAPEAVERFAYQMPTYALGGKNLVHFAGFARHIGFYPTPSGIEACAPEIAGFTQGKGSVQFPLDRDLPEDLVRKIVRVRVRETMDALAAKASKATKASKSAKPGTTS